MAAGSRAASFRAGIRVHADLELVQFLCPACGRQHAVDVEERGEPPLQDFRLDP